MKDDILKLKKSGKTHKEISEILDCSISTVSYYCNKDNDYKLNKIDDKKIEAIKNYYSTHTLKETSDKFKIGQTTIKKYCGTKRVKLSVDEKRKKMVEHVTKRRKKIKQMSVEYKGGSCEICGYNRCIGALEFHHLDPNEKDFSLSHRGHCFSWERVKKELDKCILVCANCHREIHEEFSVVK